mmetsp:Transcript_83881/g.148353  ORF Transcript_83881/g.148353 Transcript_83881/m.148353 type:complete len:209 (+) Transcript_83881:245-871(+)
MRSRVVGFWQKDPILLTASMPTGTLYFVLRQTAAEPKVLVQTDFAASATPRRSWSVRSRCPEPARPFCVAAASFICWECISSMSSDVEASTRTCSNFRDGTPFMARPLLKLLRTALSYHLSAIFSLCLCRIAGLRAPALPRALPRRSSSCSRVKLSCIARASPAEIAWEICRLARLQAINHNDAEHTSRRQIASADADGPCEVRLTAS